MNKPVCTDDLRLDYLLDPSCPLYQHPDHFCINTDTALLARFANPRPNDRILDIGCNNGALLLWLDKTEGIASLDGVEVLDEPARVASMNAEKFGRHPFSIHSMPIQEFDGGPFDLIVSNPPYFPLDAHTKPDILNYRHLGRMEVHLDLKELFSQAARLSDNRTRFCLVHRPGRIAEILEEMAAHGFGLSRLQIAYDLRDGQAKSLLAEGIYKASPIPEILPACWIDAKGKLHDGLHPFE